MPRDRLVLLILLSLILVLCGSFLVFSDQEKTSEAGFLVRISERVEAWIAPLTMAGNPLREAELRSRLRSERQSIPDTEGLQESAAAWQERLQEEEARFPEPSEAAEYAFGNAILGDLSSRGIELVRYRFLPGEELRMECILRGEVVQVMDFFRVVETAEAYQRIAYASLKETAEGILEGEVEIVRLYAH